MEKLFGLIVASIVSITSPLFAMDSDDGIVLSDKNHGLKYTTTVRNETKKTEKINTINKIGQPRLVGNFYSKGNCPSNYSRNVQQHYVGYTNDQFPIIGSAGAGPCVIMAVHNPKIGLAALCHVDQATDLGSLDIIFDNLGTSNNYNLDIHLVGGDESSIDMVYEIIQKIEMRENLFIKSSDLLNSDYVKSRYSIYGKQLAIDSRTGLVYTHFDSFTGSRIDTSWDYLNQSPLRIEQELAPDLSLDEKHKIKIEKTEKINTINKIGQPGRVGNFYSTGNCPSNYSRHVQQHYVGYTNNQFPIIGSTSAGTGVIMAVHNPKIRLAALCFVDQATDLGSLDIIFDNLGTSNNYNLDIHLVGGDESSIDMVYEIVQKIEIRENIFIKSSDLLNSEHVKSRYSTYGKRLAIDSRTGFVYTHFDSFTGSRMDTSWDYLNQSPLRIEQELAPNLSFQR